MQGVIREALKRRKGNPNREQEKGEQRRGGRRWELAGRSTARGAPGWGRLGRPGGAAGAGGEGGRDITPGPPSPHRVGGASARRAGAGSRRGKRRSRHEYV